MTFKEHKFFQIFIIALTLFRINRLLNAELDVSVN